MLNALDELTRRRPDFAAILPDVERACGLVIDAYHNGGKTLVCGNGGSCADADHIVGELMKGFLSKRPLAADLSGRLNQLGAPDLAEKLQTPLRAINLCTMPALSTAFANDVEPDYVYAQLTLGYADRGDVFIGISASGNARNVRHAAVVAKALGTKLIGLTGARGGQMNESGLYDVLIRAPETVTHHIQEAHIAIYHAMCLTVEAKIFADNRRA
jgi:D-sedoheptulose 7-phosphate isomerase